LEAIDVCKKDPKINLVLMDIKMPVMDGIAALKEIKKIRKDLPVIAQTAYYAQENQKQELLELGFDDFIIKPILAAELFRKIERTCLKPTE
jgi:CheY-like chemotaxis protein